MVLINLKVYNLKLTDVQLVKNWTLWRKLVAEADSQRFSSTNHSSDTGLTSIRMISSVSTRNIYCTSTRTVGCIPGLSR
ncbi:hypothetical protein BGX38DRAFT_1194060 [Terfezia claveryi]|nr:hypothetical protein BGX38DRAFT_1194060 [Terfezia claveryi]